MTDLCHLGPLRRGRDEGIDKPSEVSRPILKLLLIALSVLGARLAGAAEDVWSVSPYRVRVWVALEPVPDLEDAWAERIPMVLAHTVEATFASTWDLTVESAPPSAVGALAADVSWPSISVIRSLDATALDADKVFLVGVQLSGGGFEVQVRELDCRTQSWGAGRQRLVRQHDRLAETVAQELVDSFTPIGIIGRSEDRHVDVEMRAGLLAGGADQSRLIPAKGQILRGVVRKTDRLGKLVSDGLQTIPWTLLRVEKNDFGTVHCEVISGLRSPFRSRSSRNIQRMALLTVPTLQATRLRLHAPGQPDQGLAGYDVYFRLPDEKATSLIGRTDWRGEVAVPRDQHAVKIIYVKNGGRLLARLPLVPGFEPTATAELADDSQRLEAEGFLKGIQEQMVELTARRQVFALRIRRAISDKQFEKAEKLLDEMRALETREDLARKMRDRQQSLSSNDRAIQSRIDRLFRDTRSILQKYLGPSEAEQLRRELADAR